MSAEEGTVAQEGQLVIKFFAFNRYWGKMRSTSTEVHEMKMCTHELSRKFILVNIGFMLFIFSTG
jgi:hypothetical protein